MKVINGLKVFTLLFGLYALDVYACVASKSDAFPALKDENGFVVFNKTPLVDESNQESDDVAIEVEYVSCDGDVKYIAGLPFLAETGQVRAAFFSESKVDVKPKLFVIHSVEIRSDTGVNYQGSYYTIHVYSNTPAGYVRDERLSNYFGVGGDVVSNYEAPVLLYKFPYKTADEIMKKINSDEYEHWVDGKAVKLIVNKKTPIYSSANLVDKTKMYLIKGDSVLQESVEAGWVKVVYRTAKGKDIRGWIQCVDADGC